MTKVLVAIKTAHKADYFIDSDTRDWLNDRGMREKDLGARRAAQRETFIPDLGYDYKYFFGDRLRDTFDADRKKPKGYQDPTRDIPTAQVDEIHVRALDSYMSVSFKAQQIVRYALEQGYDLLFMIDDDTLVFPLNLWAVINMYDLSNKTYAGAPTGDFHTGNMLFLNRVGMELVAKAKVSHYADDLWIGRVMKDAGVPTFNIPELKSDFGPRYMVSAGSLSKDHRYAAVHSCKPDAMRALYPKKVAPVVEVEPGEAAANAISTLVQAVQLLSEDDGYGTGAAIFNEDLQFNAGLVENPMTMDVDTLPTPEIPEQVFDALKESQEG